MKSAASPSLDKAKTPVFAKPPLRPHRRLFVFLCILLGLWVLTLLGLFFTTVYPYRHSITTTQPVVGMATDGSSLGLNLLGYR
jgi:hypothetical protein